MKKTIQKDGTTKIQIRGPYQFKLEKSRLERNEEVIVSSGKNEAEDIVDGYTHYVTIKS